MAEYYKHEIAKWNVATDDLTLEQEAAYLRIVNAIRLNERPITLNKFALCGMLRCNDRKAKRILDELVAAGLIDVSDGLIRDKLQPAEPPVRQAIPADLRAEVMRSEACAYCGCTSGPFEVDHITPVSRGGTNDPENLTCACRSCNRSKGAKTVKEWMQ